METLLALVVGVLFAAGIYLLLDGNLVRAVFGLVLMSNAANLLFFTAGRVLRGVPPLVPEGMAAPVGAVANPLAQALVLTAIVIGFGLVSFALVLVYRYHRTFGTVEAAGAPVSGAPSGGPPGPASGAEPVPVQPLRVPRLPAPTVSARFRRRESPRSRTPRASASPGSETEVVVR
jgi:multicomponent Na+:H+ antiporter subunit C